MSLHRIVLTIAFLSGVGGPSSLLASPTPWNATVLWARADRAYLVLADSASVEPGTALTFEEGGATIARGEVVVAYEGQLVSVRVTSGSLDSARSFSSVRVLAEPPSLGPMHLLRVGYPSPTRPNLLFDCAQIVPRAGDLYRVDPLSDRSFRFVLSHPEAFRQHFWPPDTILVRLFDVAADEEIALERGELDVAVFWPGEPSPHIRAQTSWKADPAGSLEWGVLTAEAPSGTEAEGIAWKGSAAQSLRNMNNDLFRGDLSECSPDLFAATPDTVTGTKPHHVKFQVSRSIPGWEPLERRLNQGLPAKPGATLVVRMNRVQRPNPAAAPGSGVSPALLATPDSCAFVIRCPILSAPRLRTYLNAFGPDALVQLLTCSRKTGAR